MQGHQTNSNKFKRIETIQSIFADHNAMKLEINYRKKGKLKNMWKLNSILLNDQWLEIGKYFEMNENKDTTYQNLWPTSKRWIRRKFIAVNTSIKKEDLKLIT